MYNFGAKFTSSGVELFVKIYLLLLELASQWRNIKPKLSLRDIGKYDFGVRLLWSKFDYEVLHIE